LLALFQWRWTAERKDCVDLLTSDQKLFEIFRGIQVRLITL
jgi:hypothetical protein